MGSHGVGNDEDGNRKTARERDSTMNSTMTNSNMGDVTGRQHKNTSRRPTDSTMLPYEKPKKGAFSRLSGRWKGKRTSGSSANGHSGKTVFVLMPDLMENDPVQEVPPKAKGNVTLKKCKKLSRKKEYRVKLQEGVLKLFPKGNTAAALEPEFKIDLSQVTVSYDDNVHRLKLMFKVEAHQFIPESVDDYYMWKDMMYKHRLYRQDLVRKGLNCSESSIKTRVPVVEPTQTVLKKPPVPIETITVPLIAPPPPPQPPPTISIAVSNDDKKSNIDLLTRALEECTTLHRQSAELLAEMVKATNNTRLLFAEVQSVWVEMKANKGGVDGAVSKTELPLVSAIDGTDESDDSDDDEEVSTKTSSANVMSLDAAGVKKKGKLAITPSNVEIGVLANANTPLNTPVSTPALTPVSTPATTPPQRPETSQDKKEEEKVLKPVQPPPPAPAPKKKEVKPPTKQPTPTQAPDKKTDEDKPPSVSLLPPGPTISQVQVVQKPPLPPRPQPPPPPPPPVVAAPPPPPPPPPAPVQRVRRDLLPSPQLPGEALGLSALAAAAMRGLPITTFEPLGLLQVICEELRFVPQTLARAVNSTDSVERMCYVAAFAISGYSCMVGRNRKPFNPMMGETFDYISEDGWRYHGEQVGHHPPCSAVTASGRGFEWWQTVQGVHKTTWGGNIELMPEFPVRLRIGGDEYIWNKVKTTILNAASNPENRVIRNEGVMMIKCSNGVECKMVFKGDKNSVNGEIKDKRSGATCKLIGRWDRGLNRQLPGEDQENVFEVPPPHPYARSYYGFSKFSMTLNELFPEDRDKLPYTDSRFRPDMRFLEYADAGRALAAKHQLEGDQRMRAKTGRAARPIWFEFRTDDWSKKNMWLSNERYWRAKQQKFQDDYSQTACHVFGSQESRQ